MYLGGDLAAAAKQGNKGQGDELCKHFMGVVSKKAVERSAQEFHSYEFGNGTEGEREKKEQNSAPITDAGANCRHRFRCYSSRLETLVRSGSNAIRSNAPCHEMALSEELLSKKRWHPACQK